MALISWLTRLAVNSEHADGGAGSSTEQYYKMCVYGQVFDFETDSLLQYSSRINKKTFRDTNILFTHHEVSCHCPRLPVPRIDTGHGHMWW